MITRSASGGLVQQPATPPVAPTKAITSRGSTSSPQGLPPPDSAVLSSCSAKKRARPDSDDHGGAAAKVQTHHQPIEERRVVGPAPPQGKWARRSGTEATSKNQGNSAPAEVQVYKHTCYTLVH